MELDALTAISPIDGRYRGKTEKLADYFSEYALIRYRVRVEIEYFITLCELPLPQLKGFDHSLFETLRNIYRNFSQADAQRVKTIEQTTNHDVKAVEYFIKEELDKIGGLDDYKEFIHFGLTSQDINNTSVPLSIKEALEEAYYPLVEELIAQLRSFAEEWKDVPMLAKTHGQPASPTRLGKEVMVYVLKKILMQEYKHPIHRELEEKAKEVGGHGGMDFIMDYRMIYCLQNGLPLDMDVYDLAEWCCLAPLTAISLENNSAPVEIPDFTRGGWDKIKGYRHAFVD